MAISGLHFSIIAAFLGFALSLFFPRKLAAVIVLLLLSCYFLFLGMSPSVLRAWVSVTIALGALFIERKSIALNSLGIALLFIAVGQPLWTQHIGFQFSFGITAAILLFFAPCDRWLKKFFPKRVLSQVVNIGWLDQHGYCFLNYARQAVSLSLAVNLVALPLTLYHFHQFPVMSLIYNLFFPPMVSISLLLLIPGLALAWIFPWLGQQLHVANETYTQFLLNFAFNLPKAFDVIWYVDTIPTVVLCCYLAILLVVGIGNFEQEEQQD
jgi:competence protein ComEC